uniref:Reverse transcriptase domain-containing protein n=1 Tax=Tanacetum cinerariifolium TaxID=118510 RepID=A0A699K6H0_TANCI|nr:reverse transcriptase domain-containing protein [Tanacetum cinerariifolium]
MCDASDFTIGVVLRQRKMKHFQPIHYASKIMTEAQIHYTKTEKEMLAVVYAFEKSRPYLVLSKSIVYTTHSALKYLLSKQDAKPRLENPQMDVFENKDMNENFPLEDLGVDKLSVIIAKDLKVDEKEALLKVLKSYKRAIAWKITDIKGIDPRFYTHKILMEEDYKPSANSKTC